MSQPVKQLESVIGYEFKSRDILMLALTHSSYANEIKQKGIAYNERLEFLGDSVLGLIISEYIYTKFPENEEGKLTKMRSKIVCEATLSECAKDISLGSYMLFGKGEEATGGRTRKSILADAFEALLAAIYLDGGMESVKPILFKLMGEKIVKAEKGLIVDDYKTHLQEIIQKNKDNKIKYELIKQSGPDHNKIFVTAVKLNDKVIGTGQGKSKKESEQEAAKMALENNNVEN